MVLVHAFFCFVWMSLERNTYKGQHVMNNSFIIAVSKFISVIEMKELVIVNDLSYSMWELCCKKNLREKC